MIRPMTVSILIIGLSLSSSHTLAQQPGPGGGPEPGQRRGGRGDDGPGPDLSKPTMPKDDGERKILETLAEAQKGRRHQNVSTADGRLLRQLTEAVDAKRVVELGTSTGESGMWFALALRKTGGKLFTHDIDPGRITIARDNFKKAGVEDLITIVEGDAHQTAVKNTDPIDVLFIDAEKQGYDAYLRELLPFVRPGGLIIAHNMRRPDPNPRYIEAITTNPELDSSFVLMDGAGVGITLKSARRPKLWSRSRHEGRADRIADDNGKRPPQNRQNDQDRNIAATGNDGRRYPFRHSDSDLRRRFEHDRHRRPYDFRVYGLLCRQQPVDARSMGRGRIIGVVRCIDAV